MTSQETTSDGAPFAAPEAQFQLRFERFSLFVEEFASRISLGGMFLKSREPRPVSTVISFDIKLADGFRLIQGTGEVVWMRPDGHGPEYPAGMGVRFHSLDDKGRELVLKLLEEHLKTGGEPFDIDERPLGAIDDAEEAQAAVASAFPPLPGTEGSQGGLDFDAPWGEKLPELPQEILDEDPTVLGQAALPFPPPQEPLEPPGLGVPPGIPADPAERALEAAISEEPPALASTAESFATDPADELPTMTLPGPLASPSPEPPSQGFSLAEEAVEELESLPDFDLADDTDLEASQVSLSEAGAAATELPAFEIHPADGPESVSEASGLSAFETTEAADLKPVVEPTALSGEAQRIPGFDPDQPTVELPPTSFDPGVIPSSEELAEPLEGELPSFDPGTPEEVESSFAMSGLVEAAADGSTEIDPASFEAPTLEIPAAQVPFEPEAAPSFAASPEPEGAGEASWPDLPPLGAPESFAPDPEEEPPPLSDPLDLPDPVISDPPAFPPSAAPAFSVPAPSEVAEIESASPAAEPAGDLDGTSSLYPMQDYEDDLDGSPTDSPTWKNALVRSAKPLGALVVLALLIGTAFWFRGPIAGLLGLGEQTSEPASNLAAVSEGTVTTEDGAGTVAGSVPAEPGSEAFGSESFGAPDPEETGGATGLESLEPLPSDPTAPEIIAVSAPDSSSPPESSDVSPDPSPRVPPSAPPTRSEPIVESRVRGRSATSVIGIEARQEPSGTRIVVSLDGEVSPSRLAIDTLDYAPDRQQLRISGIEAPYFPAEVEVGSTELRRIRTGLHEGAGISELRLVFDCSGPGCALGDLREGEQQFELLVRRP